MILFLAIGTGLGSVITWALCKYFYLERRRGDMRETTAQTKRSVETRDRFYAMTAMYYLSALRKLEVGDVENSKQELAFGAANFYREFRASADLSPAIQRQRRDIERHAKKSEVLRAALESARNDHAAS